MNNTGANEPSTSDNTGDDQSTSGFASIAERIGARNLWIIILTMPLFFLAFLVAIIVMFGKSEEEKLAEQEENLIPWTEPAEESQMAYPAAPVGGHGAIALDGDRLAVRVDGPDGFVVVVYDLAKGEEIARLPFPAE
ncbi:hypothetical protein [Hyphococcus sp. DH-69]|uniref:hypothetical protein n=1 Tax=Hyphococcus formosus TaxID=3143534 RepID=UPI00398AC614